VPSRERDRERLEQELETSEYQRLLLDLSEEIRSYGSSTMGGRHRLHAGRDIKGSAEDEVLRPIFQAHAEDADPHLRTISW